MHNLATSYQVHSFLILLRGVGAYSLDLPHFFLGNLPRIINVLTSGILPIPKSFHFFSTSCCSLMEIEIK